MVYNTSTTNHANLSHIMAQLFITVSVNTTLQCTHCLDIIGIIDQVITNCSFSISTNHQRYNDNTLNIIMKRTCNNIVTVIINASGTVLLHY